MRYHYKPIKMARFGSTYTKIGTIQRRLAWPLCKDDTQIREAFRIFFNKKVPKVSKKKKNGQNPKHWQYQTLVRIQSNNNSHSLLMGMQNDTDTLEDSLVVSYKTNHTIIWSRNCALSYLLKGVENLCPQENVHTDVYSIFIHNCQNLEAIKMSFSKWMDKLWYIQTVEYYSVLKRNELSSHKTHGGN